MKEFNELTSTLETYMSVEHLEIVRRACEFATVAHEHQTRSTGEPYVTHPLSVAIILAEMSMDLQSILAAVLHDVIEDTKYT
ncbi:MAG: HD domain-containing protein, partial [Francisellaceae bacterium]|nr:HD domain-containing protein [Francisellaceae bacterium]